MSWIAEKGTPTLSNINSSWRSKMRRSLIALAALLTVACINSVATPAHAETYPVCLAGGPANALECDYASFAQCRATASGGLGYCVTNPDSTLGAYAGYRSAGKRMH
jgi:hypothetical protein